MKNKRQIATRWICVITKSSILIQIGYSTQRIDKKTTPKIRRNIFFKIYIVRKKRKRKTKKNGTEINMTKIIVTHLSQNVLGRVSNCDNSS